MSFGCILGSLSAAKFPEKDCLLPLISKILGYLIVAGSTTVKLPQSLSAEKDSMEIIQHEWALPKMEQRAEEVLRKFAKQ